MQEALELGLCGWHSSRVGDRAQVRQGRVGSTSGPTTQVHEPELPQAQAEARVRRVGSWGVRREGGGARGGNQEPG